MRPLHFVGFSGGFKRLKIAALLPQRRSLDLNYRILRIVWFSELLTSSAREFAWKLR